MKWCGVPEIYKTKSEAVKAARKRGYARAAGTHFLGFATRGGKVVPVKKRFWIIEVPCTAARSNTAARSAR